MPNKNTLPNNSTPWLFQRKCQKKKKKIAGIWIENGDIALFDGSDGPAPPSSVASAPGAFIRHYTVLHKCSTIAILECVFCETVNLWLCELQTFTQSHN